MNITKSLFGLFLLAVICCTMASCSESMTDPRDGEVYKIVTIGTQTWMAENLRYKSEQSSANPASTNSKHGRFYPWEEALKVCPDGWHLPSGAEWNALEIALGMSPSDSVALYPRGTHGKALKSTTEWAEDGKGSNSSGMNILPTGNGVTDTSSFANFGTYTSFWTSEIAPWPSHALSLSLNDEGPEVSQGRALKAFYLSCRCLKN